MTCTVSVHACVQGVGAFTSYPTNSQPHQQVVIVPIVKKNTDRTAIDAAIDELVATLKSAGIRVKVRPPPSLPPGWP